MKLEKQAPPSTSLTGAFSPPPELEAKWLASKYLGQEYTEQMPFGGFGGAGKKFKSGNKHTKHPEQEDEDRYWAQMVDQTAHSQMIDVLKGGHGVPLSSEFLPSNEHICSEMLGTLPLTGITTCRLHECPVLHYRRIRYTLPDL